MKQISFLIGSGFSVPAGYLTTTEINKRLSKIDSKEIMIHTSGMAKFLNGETDLNASFMGLRERNFVQEFLKFYNEKILQSDKLFHYETFFDYYTKVLESGENSNELKIFVNKFLEQNNTKYPLNMLINDFNRTFNQLLAQLLTKHLEKVHLCSPYPPKYRNFMQLIEEIGKSYQINFHTLNHDTYLEYLSISDCMHAELDDGFSELGSPFYGDKRINGEEYKVRLSLFTNKYNTRFRLFKLHGSINHYWFRASDKPELLKLPAGISPIRLYKEQNNNGKLMYLKDHTNYHPDFLTGISTKINRYNNGDYYLAMFIWFKDNLMHSNILIIIGYGFRDIKINEYIQEYATDISNIVFVIDIIKPEHSILEKKNIYFLPYGVSHYDNAPILEAIKGDH